MRPEPWHILILLIVIIVLFGAKRLPDITRNVGKSMRIFKTEVKSLRDDDDAPASRAPGTTTPADEAPRASLEGSAVDEARAAERRHADEHHRPSA